MNLYYSVKGDPAQSRKYQEDTFLEADKIQDIEIMTPCGYGLCFSYIIDGSFIKLNNIAPKVIALLERTQRENEFFGMHGNPHSMLHVFYGFALGGLGEFAQGEQLCEKGVASAHRTNHPYSIGLAYANYGNLCIFKWDGEKAIKIYQSAIEYQEKSQSAIFLGMSWGFQGAGYYLIGEYDTAIKLLEKGIQMQTDMKLPFVIALMQVYLSMVHFDLGNFNEANALAEQAVKLAQTNREKWIEGFALLQLGRVIGRMERSQLQKAEECIFTGMKILEELKIKPTLSIGFLFLGELYAHAGQKEKSLKNLMQAEGLFQEMGINYWLGRTKKTLEALKSN
jgi:tetratricopeptide (TPR) repeat protein